MECCWCRWYELKFENFFNRVIITTCFCVHTTHPNWLCKFSSHTSHTRSPSLTSLTLSLSLVHHLLTVTVLVHVVFVVWAWYCVRFFCTLTSTSSCAQIGWWRWSCCGWWWCFLFSGRFLLFFGCCWYRIFRIRFFFGFSVVHCHIKIGHIKSVVKEQTKLFQFKTLFLLCNWSDLHGLSMCSLQR